MTNLEKLKQLQERMVASGVRDVKFFWGPEAHKMTAEELAGHVVRWLEAYERGEYTVIQEIGDAP